MKKGYLQYYITRPKKEFWRVGSDALVMHPALWSELKMQLPKYTLIVHIHSDNPNPDWDLKIKQLRMALGMYARAFGEACGLAGRNIPRTVYRWEAGDQEPNGASRMLIEQLRGKLERRRRR